MSITVELKNRRHLAAVAAVYAATIPTDPNEPAPYADETEYVQAEIERVADSWADTNKVDHLSVADFILRFSGPEYSAITTSEDRVVVEIVATLRGRADVRLGSPDAVNGMAYLVANGYVTSERAAVILAY